jgi:hypothetical protein
MTVRDAAAIETSRRFRVLSLLKGDFALSLPMGKKPVPRVRARFPDG